MQRPSSARSKATPKASQPQTPVETWKPIPQARDLFEVSDLGNVKNLLTGALVKPYVKTKNGVPTGRLYVRIDVYGVRRNYSIARLVLAAFVGQHPTNFHEASHLDDNPANNVLTNLAWETRRKNLERRKLNVKGSKNANAKLTTEYAYWIYRAYHLKKASIRQLAASWNVGVMTVSNLVNQTTWSTFGFAEQLAQGNTDYIEPATATITPALASDHDNVVNNPFFSSDDNNCFTLAGEEMLAQVDNDEDDEDAAELVESLIPAASIIAATATPIRTKRPRSRRF